MLTDCSSLDIQLKQEEEEEQGQGDKGEKKWRSRKERGGGGGKGQRDWKGAFKCRNAAYKKWEYLLGKRIKQQSSEIIATSSLNRDMCGKEVIIYLRILFEFRLWFGFFSFYKCEYNFVITLSSH